MVHLVPFIAPTLLTAFLVTTVGCAPSVEQRKPLKTAAASDAARVKAAEQRESHEIMVALLADIAQRTADENLWLGDRAVREGRLRVKQFAGDGETESKGTIREAATRMGLAIEEARVGNEYETIEQLERARTILQDQADAPKLLLRESAFRLGVAYMRLGETQNCCRQNTADSCILPIQGGGLHTRPEASEKAIKLLEEVLRLSPENSNPHLKARWLLNIAYMTLGRYPHEVPAEHRIDPSVFASDETFPKFNNIAAKLGVNTFGLCGGAIVDDFDDDGYLDIVTSSSDTAGQLRLFRNRQDGKFADVTGSAGLIGILGGLNCIQADYDNDGHLDILVLRGAWLGPSGRHPNSLLRNKGDGTFVDVTVSAGLAEVNHPTQTGAWADYDNDGDLDLYIGNEHTPQTSAPCQLFENKGDGTFSDAARKAGVENFRFAKGVVWGDFDNDRLADLYVSNLAAENRLYHNNGDGTFTDVAARVGVAKPLNSFPVWFWDYDNDGALDIYVSSYNGDVDALGDVVASRLGLPFEEEMPRLYRGDGRGGFKDVAAESGLVRLHLPMGANFGDLDNDGYQDFYLGTGYPDYEALMPNVMYRNRAGGKFADVTTAGGFGHLQKGHGVAFADLDNDGDQDIFAQTGGNFPGDKYFDCLYENPGFDNHWITIRLVGKQSNRSAIGARLKIEIAENGQSRLIHRRVSSGGSFGANPLRQSVGLGAARQIQRLTVYWPASDQTQIFEDIDADQTIQIVEGAATYEKTSLRQLSLGQSDNR